MSDILGKPLSMFIEQVSRLIKERTNLQKEILKLQSEHEALLKSHAELVKALKLADTFVYPRTSPRASKMITEALTNAEKLNEVMK